MTKPAEGVFAGSFAAPDSAAEKGMLRFPLDAAAVAAIDGL